MKILKYEKKKNGMYQVFFDNDNNIDISEEIILKYNLLLKKDIDNSLIDKMLDENKIYIAYNLAIKYISIKMRSRKEIREYLSKKNIDYDSINEVIKILEKEKYLDDDSYAKAFVNDKMLLSNDGPNKIRSKLIELGINSNSINNALELFDYDLQKEKVTKIAKKLVEVNRNKSATLLKNKIITYLVNLGYDKSVINSVLSTVEIKNDKDIAKKEYEKIYNKLSRKYSGSDLEFRVKQKMYALGFNNYEE